MFLDPIAENQTRNIKESISLLLEKLNLKNKRHFTKKSIVQKRIINSCKKTKKDFRRI